MCLIHSKTLKEQEILEKPFYTIQVTFIGTRGEHIFRGC